MRTYPGSIEPLTYVEDVGDRFLITLDLPLVDKKDLEVSASDLHLEISARMCRKISYQVPGASGERCQASSFYTSIALPLGVDPDGARAVFKKGILTIELPKRVQKKKITVE